MSPNYLYSNLKYLRNKAMITQSEFAALMKYKSKTVGGWEEGRNHPNLTNLIEIADFFKITLDDLIKKDLTQIS